MPAQTNNKIIFAFAGATVCIFLFGLMQLFALRFEAGDIYAPYSSFRSDPIGTRALYEALGSLPGISVRRNVEPILRLPDGRGKTLIICGASTSEDPENVVEKLETFAADGGRIIITFYPKYHSPDILSEDEKKEEKEKEEKKEEDERGKPTLHPKYVSIEDRWGFDYETSYLPVSTERNIPEGRAMKPAGPSGLPRILSWHSALFFDKPDEAWNKVYVRDNRAVIMERTWLKGSIVLCSDSYHLSNEAMRRGRYPELIAWLVGPSSTVIFDEVHLGTRKRPGVMSLARRYRLEGVLAVIVFLAALFIWKNAISLVPKREASSIESALSADGRDSSAALVNLLRRSIPARRLLSVCSEEWGRSATVKGDLQKRIQAVADRERTLPAGERDPVKAYRTICAILRERN